MTLSRTFFCAHIGNYTLDSLPSCTGVCVQLVVWGRGGGVWGGGGRDGAHYLVHPQQGHLTLQQPVGQLPAGDHQQHPPRFTALRNHMRLFFGEMSSWTTLAMDLGMKTTF